MSEQPGWQTRQEQRLCRERSERGEAPSRQGDLAPVHLVIVERPSVWRTIGNVVRLLFTLACIALVLLLLAIFVAP